MKKRDKLHFTIDKLLTKDYKMFHDFSHDKSYYLNDIRFKYDYYGLVYKLSFFYDDAYMCTCTMYCSEYTYDQLCDIYKTFIANCFSIANTLKINKDISKDIKENAFNINKTIFE